MPVLYRTTMVPTKLALLSSWLPTRAWYRGDGERELRKAGGFRLDDPDGEVGIEFMVATDHAGEQARTYHGPLTYRGSPLAGADEELVGTAMHGVLGKRWIYDAVRDPVAVAQIVAVLAGRTKPQAQSESGTPDPSVVVRAAETLVSTSEFGPAQEVLSYTDIPVGQRVVRVRRLLNATGAPAEACGSGHVPAPWRTAGGIAVRSVFLSFAERPRER
ncbi:1,4-alpha-glucan branching protein [Nocardia sp. NBC_01730]|uniref:maltokinase N-terminal cap-like domain-containing protein n=1 Tax=Nocardia sp. NBC_01730 TaxID=2975998 RepID=UPI002E1463B4|nr:1,4-alpha-glucan branching protein [Nocardia sp. NBC_01730]